MSTGKPTTALIHPPEWRTPEVNTMCDLYEDVRKMLDARNREVVALRKQLRSEQSARADAEQMVKHLQSELRHARERRSIEELSDATA